MSGNFNPVVSRGGISHYKIQTASEGFQVPFFFGGSNVPTALNLNRSKISGQGIVKSAKPYAKNIIKLYLPK
jgi:hypothetical protein